MAAYVDALCAEIAASAASCSALHARPPGDGLATVFFGGGTPSLLAPEQLARVLDALRAAFGIAPDAEVSLEVDPGGAFDAARLEAYLECGVTRVNLGIQSFSQRALGVAGRAHTAEEGLAALAVVAASGARSWGLDLISGLPHQTPAEWAETLAAAVAAHPKHVSVYDLQVEPGTAFGRWYKAGAAPLPSDDEAAAMYCAAATALSGAGLEHYEISNFAAEGHRCAHNLNYWRNGAWHAFGLAAASHIARRRFSRPRRMAEYFSWVAEGSRGGYPQPADSLEEEDDPHERLQDRLMLGMRLAEGVDLDVLRADFGDRTADAVCAALQPFAPRHVRLTDATGGVCYGRRPAHAALTDPDGFLLSNEVLSSVFAKLPSVARPAKKAAS